MSKIKCEMQIGKYFVQGEYDAKQDEHLNLWRWRFQYKDDETSGLSGTHISNGKFSSEAACKENAERVGVEF